MPEKVRCIILIIRMSPDLAVVLIWIIPHPYQYIGRGFILSETTREPSSHPTPYV
jgi:hypothetical protein